MRQIIKEIRNLNLAEYPINEIRRLIQEFGVFPAYETLFNYPKIIHRACPISDNEEVSTVSRLKYKLPELNDTYQRASTPEQTMFYGTVLPENPSNDLILNARITGACETVAFLRNPEIKEGRKKLIYGKWLVKDEILGVVERFLVDNSAKKYFFI